jgi:CRP/FNR family cyclic AMP-dependent transcriptional regulator
MYLTGEQSTYAEHWINRLQGLPVRLLAGAQPCDATLELPADTSLATPVQADRVYLIEAGRMNLSVNGRTCFYLEEGDLLGLAPAPEGFTPRYHTTAPVRLVPYDRETLLAHVGTQGRASVLADYLGGQAWLLAQAVTQLRQPQHQGTNGFLQVPAGDVLIRQGDEPDHVFIIMEGHAEVFVDGLKVGDVAKEEIFGAMAVFTEEKRTATVIASTPCTVMLIPKDQFLAMTASNPNIAHSLIESMARKISALNHQLTHAGPEAY